MDVKTIVVLLALGLGALPAWGEEVILTPERVLHFDSNLQVNPDGTLQVTETIKVTATGDKIKHGLVRKFPVRYQSNQGRTIEVGFELRRALCNGQPEPYRLEHETDTVLVYVGRHGTLLIPGVYTYTLVYRTRRQLGFFPHHDELYWNVTGSQWPFDIEKATARVDLPTGASILETAGYTGTFGAQAADVTQGVDEHLQPIFATKHPLHPGEGLTVAVSWPRGFVQRPDAREQFLQDLQDWIPAQGLVSLGTLLALFLFYWAAWALVVRRPRPGAAPLRRQPAAHHDPAGVQSHRAWLIAGAILSLTGWVAMVWLATDAANTAGLEALWLFWMVTAVGMILLAAFQFKTALASGKIKLWLLCLFELAVVVFIAALAQSIWTRVAEGLTPAGAVACGLIPWVHAAAFWLFKVRTPLGERLK